MLKLSITLPNNAQINLESEDEVVIDRILGIVLSDVSRALLTGMSMPEPAAAARSAPDRVVSSPPAAVQPAIAVTNETVAPATPTPPAETAPQSADAVLSSTAGDAGSLFSNLSEPADETNQFDGIGQEYDLGAEEQEAQIPGPSPASWSRPEIPGNGVEATNGSPAGAGNHLGMSNLVPAVSEQAFVDFCRAANPLGDMRRVVVAAEGASRYLAMDGVDAESLGNLFDIVGWPRAHNFVQTLRNAARSKFGWLERLPGRAGHYTVTDLGRSTALGR